MIPCDRAYPLGRRRAVSRHPGDTEPQRGLAAARGGAADGEPAARRAREHGRRAALRPWRPRGHADAARGPARRAARRMAEWAAEVDAVLEQKEASPHGVVRITGSARRRVRLRGAVRRPREGAPARRQAGGRRHRADRRPRAARGGPRAPTCSSRPSATWSSSRASRSTSARSRRRATRRGCRSGPRSPTSTGSRGRRRWSTCRPSQLAALIPRLRAGVRVRRLRGPAARRGGGDGRHLPRTCSEPVRAADDPRGAAHRRRSLRGEMHLVAGRAGLAIPRVRAVAELLEAELVRVQRAIRRPARAGR